MFAYLVLLLSVFHDPERIIDRMHNSVQESLGWFQSFANSQMLIEDHQELIKINNKLQKIKNKWYIISQNATH